MAYRVASRARSSAACRREHEQRGATSPALVSPEQGDRKEIVASLHEEIERLPERCRVLVVLCDLQGLSHEKAARHLGWPVGTVKSRLARARVLLRADCPAADWGLLPACQSERPRLGCPFRSVELCCRVHLVDSTVRAAASFAAGKAFAVVSQLRRVATLIEEVSGP